MLQRLVRKTTIALVAFLMTLTAGISPADDTEVYFNSGSSSGNADNEIAPNVLFILDLKSDQFATGNRVDKINAHELRIGRLKESLREVITSAGNVRIGLMHFPVNGLSTSVPFPISDLDIPASDILSEQDDRNHPVFVPSDDAEEARVAASGVAVGDVDIDDASLNVDRYTGLRFQGLIIPQGASITEARLILTASNSDSTTTDVVNIQAEKADDSATFSETATDISGRETGTKSTRWTLPATTTDATISSDNLSAVIQEVTDRADWCAGNALTLILSGTNSSSKEFYSYDNKPSDSAKLHITYNAGSEPSCMRTTETAQIAMVTDDVSNDERFGRGSGFETGKTIGFRFQGINIPQGATILEADIRMTGFLSRGSIDITISGEDEDAANTYGDVNTRTKTSASALYQPPYWGMWNIYRTSDLTTIVQEIINRPGWETGNPMAFILESTGEGRRIALTYDDDPRKAALLSITYQSTGNIAPTKTVRSRLLEIVNDYEATDYLGRFTFGMTDGLLGAARYWRGEPILPPQTGSAVVYNHPGSYCRADDNCQGVLFSYRGEFFPYGLYGDGVIGIRGAPVYISPFQTKASCAANYQILLSDGVITGVGGATSIQAELGDIPGFGVDTDGDGEGDGRCRDRGDRNEQYKCATDLAEFLYKKDQSSTLPNDQTVITHTVSFIETGEEQVTESGDVFAGTAQTDFLEELATLGGGSFYETRTADDLVTAFETILIEVESGPTSLAAPSLATNAFNRLLSRDEVYFSLFTPTLDVAWDGNVKKYKICIDSDPDGDGVKNCTPGTFLDATGAPATDTQTGRFKETAKSLWSDTVDGLQTTEGGTGAEFDDYTERVIYTETTASGTAPASGTQLNTAGFNITAANWDSSDLATVRDAVCLIPSTTSGSDCEDRMLWMLGKVLTTKETDVDADTRWTVHDVLHSNPSIITYSGSDSSDDGITDTFVDKLVYGSNDGALHFVNASTGKEEWSFMPQFLLNNQPVLFTNVAGDHIYGMDLTPVLNINDVDGNGVIETGKNDYVHIIAGMRRGGKFIYALDVSANISSAGGAVVPKFLWRIEGGVSGSDYERLAQTWSKPVLGKIAIADGNGGTTTKQVMVFGGGYDSALDSGFGTAATGGNNNQGNMIFIADPSDGSLIFSIGGTDSGADIEVAAMKYAIPSRLTLLDSDADSADDRIYVGDTGGQIWRVDLANDINPGGTSPEGSSVVGRLAAISTQGTETEERRFFEPPSVIQVKDTLYANAANSEYDYVLLGTGNRANPLNTVTKDRFYAFRDYTVGKMTGGTESSPSNLARDYPRTSDEPISNSASDLIDITTDILDENSTTVDSSFGWYYDFFSENSDKAGEKVLSAPVTIAKKVLFTSYIPDENNSTDLCTINTGSGNAYNIDILTTKATLDWDADGTVDNITDRKISLGSGIPSAVVPIFTKEGVIGITSAGGAATQLGELANLPRYKTYWYED